MPQSDTVIDATIQSGWGAARRSLAVLKPHLRGYLPQIDQCYDGTINLRLDQPLRVLNPDLETDPIQWGGPGTATEVFGFQEIEFEFPIGGPRHRAWILIPHNSPHFNDLFGAEVIAAQIPGVKASERCRIHIPKPHRVESVVVI